MYRKLPSKYQFGGGINNPTMGNWQNMLPQDLFNPALQTTQDLTSNFASSLKNSKLDDKYKQKLSEQFNQIGPAIFPMAALMQGQQGYMDYLQRPRQDLTQESGFYGFQKGGPIKPDSNLENIFEILDPTGISSYDDVYREYKKSGLSPETAMEVIGALPFVGKIGKLTKAGIHLKKYKGLDNALYKSLNSNRSLANTTANSYFFTGKASDASQAYDEYSNEKQNGGMILPGGNMMSKFMNKTGYTPGYPSMNNPFNIIPSNQITMRNTPFPVMGIGSNGQQRMMYPGNDYHFPGASYVTEYPQMGLGGWLKRNFTSAVDDVKKAGKAVGNVVSDYGRGLADSFGNWTGTFDLDNSKYKTGLGRSLSGFNDKLQGATGQMGRAIGAAFVPGLPTSFGGGNQQQQPQQQVQRPLEPMSILQQFGMISGMLPMLMPQRQYGGHIYQMGGEVEEQEPMPQEVQTEVGEYVAFEDGTITKVNAKKRHSQMPKDQITDILPVGSFVFSRDPKMVFDKRKKYKGIKLEDIVLGHEVSEYSELENTNPPKEIKFVDAMNGNKFTPADMARNILNKYALSGRENDAFALKADEENKSSRIPYIEVIKTLNQIKKKSPTLYRMGGYISNLQYGDYVSNDPYPYIPMGGEYYANAQSQYEIPTQSYIQPIPRTQLLPVENFRTEKPEILSERGDPYEYFKQADGKWYTRKKGSGDNSWIKLNEKAIPIVEKRMREGVYNKPKKKGNGIKYDYSPELQVADNTLPEVEIVGQKNWDGKRPDNTRVKKILGQVPQNMRPVQNYEDYPLKSVNAARMENFLGRQFNRPDQNFGENQYGYAQNTAPGAPYFPPRPISYQEVLANNAHSGALQAYNDIGSVASMGSNLIPIGMGANAVKNAAMFGRAPVKMSAPLNPWVAQQWARYGKFANGGYIKNQKYVNTPMYFRQGGRVPRFQMGEMVGALAGPLIDLGFGIADRQRAKDYYGMTMKDIKDLTKHGRQYMDNALGIGLGTTMGNYLSQDPGYTYADLSSPMARTDAMYSNIESNINNNKRQALDLARANNSSFARSAAALGLSPQQAAAYLQQMNANDNNNASQVNMQYNDMLNRYIEGRGSTLNKYDEAIARDQQTGANLIRNNRNALNQGLFTGLGHHGQQYYNNKLAFDSQMLAARMGARNQHANFLANNGVRLADSFGNLAFNGGRAYDQYRSSISPNGINTPTIGYVDTSNYLNYQNPEYMSPYGLQFDDGASYQMIPGQGFGNVG